MLGSCVYVCNYKLLVFVYLQFFAVMCTAVVVGLCVDLIWFFRYEVVFVLVDVLVLYCGVMLIGNCYVAHQVGQILVNMVYVVGLLGYIVCSDAVRICIGMERNYFCGELIGCAAFLFCSCLIVLDVHLFGF